jgi:hypothetical protein
MDQLLQSVGIRDIEQRTRICSLMSAAADMADDDTRAALSEFVGACTRRTKRRRDEVDLTGSPALSSVSAARSDDSERHRTTVMFIRRHVLVPKYPIIMTDGALLATEDVMRAWIAKHSEGQLDRFEAPFAMKPGESHITILNDANRVQQMVALLRGIDPAVDTNTFFELHTCEFGSETWRRCPLFMHLSFAAVVCHYIARDTSARVRNGYSRKIWVQSIGLMCEFSHRDNKRRVTVSMIREDGSADRYTVVGQARLTFKDHAIMRRVFTDFEFPTVQIPDKAPVPSECPVCMESVLMDVEFSGCGHALHDGCIAGLRSRICHLCRAPFFIPRG